MIRRFVLVLCRFHSLLAVLLDKIPHFLLYNNQSATRGNSVWSTFKSINHYVVHVFLSPSNEVHIFVSLCSEQLVEVVCDPHSFSLQHPVFEVYDAF